MHDLAHALAGKATADRVSSWDRRHLGGLLSHGQLVINQMVERKAGKMPAVPGRNSFQRVSPRRVGPRMGARAARPPNTSSAIPGSPRRVQAAIQRKAA